MTRLETGMLGTSLRGLRARALLSAGSLLLIALAIGSAMVGPVFAEAVTRSYLVSQLSDQPPQLTGLSFGYQPLDPTTPDRAESEAVAAVDVVVGDQPYQPPTTMLESREVKVLPAVRGRMRLAYAEGMCEAVLLTGTCPTRPGEVIMQPVDLRTARTKVGRTLDLGRALGKVRIVGSYQVDPTQQDFWFNLKRLSSIPYYVNETSGLVTPYQAGPLLTARETFDGLDRSDYRVVVDRRLGISPDFERAELDALVGLGRQAATYDAVAADGAGRLRANNVNNLAGIAADVTAQEETGRRSITPAVISLVLVALALLMRLLSAASELRVPELALASLRGLTSRDLWALGLSEPLLLMVIAIPLGVLAGLAMGIGLIRAWLVPGLPLVVPWLSWALALAVVAVGGLVAVLAVATVLRTSLSTQLTGVRRPGSTRRLALVVEMLLGSAAIAVLASKLSGGRGGSPDLTDLALPVLLAVVAGLLVTRLVAAIATRWTRARRGTRSLAGFVAARAISRRSEGTLVILPITVAIAVGVFGVGVANAAAAWRASVAATVTPAGEVWTADAPYAKTYNLSHELDPEGRWLMTAGVVQAIGNQFSYVDAPRLARVSLWSGQWTPGLSPEEVAAAIGPTGSPPVATGRTLSITLDNALDTGSELWVELRLEPQAGSRTDLRAYAGPFAVGRSTAEVDVPSCRRGCRMVGFNLATKAGLTMEMAGDVTVLEVSADGAPVDFADAGWDVSPDVPQAQRYGEVRAASGRLQVRIDTQGGPGSVRLVPGGIPQVRPVLLGTGVATERFDTSSNVPSVRLAAGQLPIHSVAPAYSSPFIGPDGIVIDYAMLTADRELYDGMFTPYLLARADLPQQLRQELTDHGYTLQATNAETVATLDRGAYALALRLYLVVAALSLAMALVGLLVSTAVQLPARRRDAAALRVVGVPRRAVMSAVTREFFLVLGAAAVAGIVAGSVAQLVVLRTITLGFSTDIHTPDPVASIDPVALAVMAASAALILLGCALLTSWATVRGARGSTLRETAR